MGAYGPAKNGISTYPDRFLRSCFLPKKDLISLENYFVLWYALYVGYYISYMFYISEKTNVEKKGIKQHDEKERFA